jgi:predicted alpha/beta hydrolase family esterase
MLVAHWALCGSPLKVAGAFLVAPSDVEASSYPIDPNGFAPVPMARLPFPSIVVASTDDPYASIERSRAFAEAWGSRLVIIGDAGHINADTGFGEWPEGEAMLEEFCRDLRP